MDSNEEKRIKEAYAQRLAREDGDRYTWMNPATAFHLQRQEQAVLRLLRSNNISSLKHLDILEVGCGGGSELRNFIKYGADPSRLHGVDILEDRIAQGRALSPNINFYLNNAVELQFADASFDIVCQFVMFTSILDGGVRERIAMEMKRVVRPDGLIIWYDYFISLPWNRDVRGVGRSEIEALFRGWSCQLRKVTLAAPLARLVVPRSTLLAGALERLPFLRSHYLGAIKKTDRQR